MKNAVGTTFIDHNSYVDRFLFSLLGGEYLSMSEVIAVSSGKGGTGKSTICAGIGNALAQSGYTVLIMELDFGFRCLDVFFGIADKIKFDISDFICGKRRLNEVIYKIPAVPGLSVICAPADFSCGAVHNKIIGAVKRLKKLYDFVLIDTGAGTNMEIIKLLTEADRIFFVATPDTVSIRDAARLSDQLYKLGCKNQRLIINKVHKKYIDNKIVENLDNVIDTCGIQLIGVVPEDLELLLFYGKGKRISEHSSGYAAFMAIAERICGD